MKVAAAAWPILFLTICLQIYYIQGLNSYAFRPYGMQNSKTREWAYSLQTCIDKCTRDESKCRIIEVQAKRELKKFHCWYYDNAKPARFRPDREWEGRFSLVDVKASRFIFPRTESLMPQNPYKTRNMKDTTQCQLECRDEPECRAITVTGRGQCAFYGPQSTFFKQKHRYTVYLKDIDGPESVAIYPFREVNKWSRTSKTYNEKYGTCHNGCQKRKDCAMAFYHKKSTCSLYDNNQFPRTKSEKKQPLETVFVKASVYSVWVPMRGKRLTGTNLIVNKPLKHIQICASLCTQRKRKGCVAFEWLRQVNRCKIFGKGFTLTDDRTAPEASILNSHMLFITEWLERETVDRETSFLDQTRARNMQACKADCQKRADCVAVTLYGNGRFPCHLEKGGGSAKKRSAAALQKRQYGGQKSSTKKEFFNNGIYWKKTPRTYMDFMKLFDFAGGPKRMRSASECVAECESYDRCKAVNYNRKVGRCWFLSDAVPYETKLNNVGDSTDFDVYVKTIAPCNNACRNDLKPVPSGGNDTQPGEDLVGGGGTGGGYSPPWSPW